MCGRYTIAKSRQVLTQLLGKEIDPRIVVPLYNASPGQKLPAILGHDPGRVIPVLWGFRAESGRMAGRMLINARSETVHTKPLFRKSFRHRRCLVIADGFYEWQARPDGKQPWRIVRSDDGLFAFAGLWMEIGHAPVFLILTTEPNRVTRPIHDRMPLMLEESEYATWLDPAATTEALLALLDPYPENQMTAYPVSRAVNDSRNEAAGLIRPVRLTEKQGKLKW